MSAVRDFINAQRLERARAIDIACENMLVLPLPVGVLVETMPNGEWKVSLSSTEEPMTVTYRVRD